MSPRAACRLDQLGFDEVLDYAGGKMDWLAWDLPYEGEAELAGAAVDRDPARVTVDDPVSAARQAMERSGSDSCVVTTPGGVVMGVVSEEAARSAGAHDPAGDVMTFGVTTVRPSDDVHRLLHRMEEADADRVIVTRPDGVLVGVLGAAVARPAAGHDG